MGIKKLLVIRDFWFPGLVLVPLRVCDVALPWSNLSSLENYPRFWHTRHGAGTLQRRRPTSKVLFESGVAEGTLAGRTSMRGGHRESPPCADTHRSVIAFPFTLESVPSAASSKPPATSPAEPVEEPRFADHDVTTNLPCERPGLELEQLEARTTAFGEEEEEVHREEEVPALQHCLLPSSPQTPDRHPMIA